MGKKKQNHSVKIILISTGIFQEYIVYNIEQLLLLNYEVIVLTEKKYFTQLNKYPSISKFDTSLLCNNFNKNCIGTKLNSNRKGGFWHNCSKRLFILYEFMKIYNIENCIHIENDVLLYTKFYSNQFTKNKIYLTMDCPNRCIPGIIYIPQYKLLEKLINNYNYSRNDMFNMAKFFQNNRNICETFPIINMNKRYNSLTIYNSNFNKFNSIFDAAAIGQYVGGIDPNNNDGDTVGFINETCCIKYNNYKFEWVKKGQFYYPYIIVYDKYIPINNLHIHSKKLSNFLINNPIENKFITKKKMIFITGEKIQFLCDHFIGYHRDFIYNPNVLKNYKHKCLSLEHIKKPFNNSKNIFLYTHILLKNKNLDELISKLNFFKNPFILILHNSDAVFNDTHLILFDKIPLLKAIYTQNINTHHKNVIPLPIGLPNSQWNHGNLKKFRKVYNLNIKKTRDIFFNFNIKTSECRIDCFKSISGLGIKWVNNEKYYNYLKNLKKYKFCICPEGNGIDTHRFWECLYLDVIPICKKNILVEYYSKYFPIIILNKWGELDLKQLLKNYKKKKIQS